MSIETKRLEEVATVFDDRCGTVRGVQRLLRRGPYPLYVESGAVPFDDYAFDGTYLLLGSVCNVEASNGCLRVTEARGRFSVTDLYHVVACESDEDTAYLRHVLSRIPAHAHAEASGQTVRLSENSLRHIRVPWPDAAARRALVRFLDEHEAMAAEDAGQARRLLDEGAALYDEAVAGSPDARRLDEVCAVHEGRFLESSSRRSRGSVAAVSSQGVMAFTDEDGVPGPCLVLGQAGQFVIGRRMPEGAFPLEDCVAVTVADDAALTYETLVLALAAQGVRPRLRVAGRAVDALEMPLARIGELEVRIAARERRSGLQQEAARLLGEIDRLEARASERRASAEDVAARLMESRDDAVAEAASWVHVVNSNAADVDAAALGEGCARVCQAAGPVFDGSTDERRARELLQALVQEVRSVISHASGKAASSFDAAWEVLPLLFARSVEQGARWEGVLEAPDASASADELLDRFACEEPCLGFLAQLTSVSSALPAEDRTRIIRALDELPATACTGSLLRWLALESDVELVTRGPLTSEQRLDASCPGEVSDLLAAVACAFAPHARNAFDPCAREGGVLDAVRRRLPSASLTGQAERFSDALAAVMAARCEGWAFEEGALRTGRALEDDAFEGERFDLVVSVLPPNQGEWNKSAPDPNDPRWMFGTPPRNKANLAWLQHAHAHRTPGGYAVLLAADALLHEKRGCEPSVRAALIASGCVRSVIALPGGLFADDRPPMSIIVLGDAREDDCETLFVNALEYGSPGVSGIWPPRRALGASTVVRIADALGTWVRTGACDSVAGFARSVRKADVAAQGDLTPWSFV